MGLYIYPQLVDVFYGFHVVKYTIHGFKMEFKSICFFGTKENFEADWRKKKGTRCCCVLPFPIDVGPWCELNMIPLLQKDSHKMFHTFPLKQPRVFEEKRQKLLAMCLEAVLLYNKSLMLREW